jgi:hypothetical protein
VSASIPSAGSATMSAMASVRRHRLMRRPPSTPRAGRDGYGR